MCTAQNSGPRESGIRSSRARQSSSSSRASAFSPRQPASTPIECLIATLHDLVVDLVRQREPLGQRPIGLLPVEGAHGHHAQPLERARLRVAVVPTADDPQRLGAERDDVRRRNAAAPGSRRRRRSARARSGVGSGAAASASRSQRDPSTKSGRAPSRTTRSRSPAAAPRAGRGGSPRPARRAGCRARPPAARAATSAATPGSMSRSAVSASVEVPGAVQRPRSAPARRRRTSRSRASWRTVSSSR